MEIEEKYFSIEELLPRIVLNFNKFPYMDYFPPPCNKKQERITTVLSKPYFMLAILISTTINHRKSLATV